MPSAVVLVNCEVGKETEIIRKICSVTGVENACLVYGVYDIVVKVNSETMDGLEGILMQKLRPLPGVRNTITLLVSKDCGDLTGGTDRS